MSSTPKCPVGHPHECRIMTHPRTRLQVEQLEDRLTPTALQFVQSLYQTVLGRPTAPDANDPTVAAYVRALQTRQATPFQVAQAFGQSPEGDAVYAVVLYRQFLDRSPKPSEFAQFSRLSSNGVSADQLALSLILSPEFQNNPEHAGNTGFIDALYDHVLERDPAENESAYWVGMLDQGVSREAVATAIVESVEARKTFIAFAGYQALLRRTADPGGLDFWAAQLVRTRDLGTVLRSFLITPEYLAKNTTDGSATT